MSVLPLAASLALCLVPSAQAQRSSSGASGRAPDVGPLLHGPWAQSRATRSSFSSSGAQDGGLANHLPPAHENMELVGKLELSAPFGNVLPGQIADVSIFKDAAYLNSWAIKDNETDVACRRGGFFSVDISDPAAPVQKAFVPALPQTYHGEGAHTISVSTPAFRGDLLAVNNESCGPEGVGGFDLYDVSDPANPVTLIQGAGDKSPDDGDLVQDPAEVANSSHSIFLWQDGPRAYAVIVDNTELHDVDIFDITDPRDPEFIADLDLLEMFPEILDQGANGNLVLHHDMVVKEIDGVQTLLASYWDAGYVKLNVENPAAPLYLGDTSFDGPDPLTGLDPPEGNAHQAEFSADNRFILASDEDFNPYRAGSFSITGGPNAGEYPSQEVGGGASVTSLPDRTLNGPVVYGGYGCDASAPVPLRSAVDVGPLAAGEEAIIVLQRGPSGDPSATEEACFPGEKAANGIEAGWDAVVLVNRHLGDAASDVAFCGSGDFPPGVAIVTVCTTHEAFHRLFGSAPNFELPVPAGDAPPLGTVGQRVEATSVFDGWGFAHLYRNENGKISEVGAFAIPEALDPRYGAGFGDLSIHEVATDPATNLAYSSYYSGGLRTLSFGDGGIEEVGRFIDEGGSNFWGVEQFTDKDGNRLIAGSDRDYGLYIVKYTGPGAVLDKPPGSSSTTPPATTPPATTPPATTPPAATSPAATSPTVVPSSFFGFGSLKRLTIRNRSASATITVPGPGKATAILKASIRGKVVQLAKSTATATRAGKLRLTLRLSQSAERSLRRTLSQRRTRRTSGVLHVSFTRTGGVQRTRNKALSIAIGR